MSVNDLLQRLQAHPQGAPLDFRKIREEIHDEFDRATTDQDRSTLLAIFKATADLVERSGLPPEDLETFRNARLSDYRLLLVKESLVGENVCSETLDAVTKREVAAGRMASDDELRVTAQNAMAAPHLSRVELMAMATKKQSFLSRFFSWLKQLIHGTRS